MAGTLDGYCHASLVSGTQATFSPRLNCAAIGHKSTEIFQALPVYDERFINAERTNLAPMKAGATMKTTRPTRTSSALSARRSSLKRTTFPLLRPSLSLTLRLRLFGTLS